MHYGLTFSFFSKLNENNGFSLAINPFISKVHYFITSMNDITWVDVMRNSWLLSVRCGKQNSIWILLGSPHLDICCRRSLQIWFQVTKMLMLFADRSDYTKQQNVFLPFFSLLLLNHEKQMLSHFLVSCNSISSNHWTIIKIGLVCSILWHGDIWKQSFLH